MGGGALPQPNPDDMPTNTGKMGAQTATGKNGEKYILQNGAWVQQ